MRYRIRDGFLDLCGAVSAWYRGVCSRFRQRGSGRTEVIKGTASRVIVVKSPDPGIFREAFFILRDDYFSNRGISQEELLRQARQAARRTKGGGLRARRGGAEGERRRQRARRGGAENERRWQRARRRSAERERKWQQARRRSAESERSGQRARQGGTERERSPAAGKEGRRNERKRWAAGAVEWRGERKEWAAGAVDKREAAGRRPAEGTPRRLKFNIYNFRLQWRATQESTT